MMKDVKTNEEMVTESEALLGRIAGLMSHGPLSNKSPIVAVKLRNLLDVLEDLEDTVEEI